MAMDFCTLYGEPDCFDYSELDAHYDALAETAWGEFCMEMDYRATDHRGHVDAALEHHIATDHMQHVVEFFMTDGDIPF